MTKETKAELAQKAAEWMKSSGYDRRTWQGTSQIIANFIDENRSEVLAIAGVVATEGKCDCAVCGEEFKLAKPYHNVCDWCAENTC